MTQAVKQLHLVVILILEQEQGRGVVDQVQGVDQVGVVDQVLDPQEVKQDPLQQV